MQSSTCVLESQVDWVTVAYHGHEQTDILGDFANGLIAGEVAAGNDPRPFDVNGYVGWRVGRVRYGERSEAGLLQLSGQLAEDHLHDLVPYASTVTRLDLAVTLRLDPPDMFYGTGQYAQFVDHYHATEGSALPWEVADADTGHTVYLGTRRSDAFYRLYNKEQQCRADADAEGLEVYRACWRHELELHDDAAKAVAVALLAEPARAPALSGYVGDYVRKHGGSVDWDTSAAPAQVGSFRRRSDRDSRLRWFAKQVAPALARELQRGNPHEVWRSLGLDEPPHGMD